jgi:hypothetical protein
MSNGEPQAPPVSPSMQMTPATRRQLACKVKAGVPTKYYNDFAANPTYESHSSPIDIL